jgi:peroxiredoxin
MTIFFNAVCWYSTFQEYSFSAQYDVVIEKFTAIVGRAVFFPQINAVH